MYRVLATTVQEGALFPPPISLQTTGSPLPLWVTAIVVGSVLFGIGIVVWRRTRSEPVVEPSSPEPQPVPSPLRSEQVALTNEERIVQLLQSNEGRMRQTRIVEDTDWSKSKVSMLLSDMETDGTISKLRVGRENIISLPGAEPEAALSPFEGQP